MKFFVDIINLILFVFGDRRFVSSQVFTVFDSFPAFECTSQEIIAVSSYVRKVTSPSHVALLKYQERWDQEKFLDFYCLHNSYPLFLLDESEWVVSQHLKFYLEIFYDIQCQVVLTNFK